eukprot:CAMPEP_0172712730 /NCGR_PEP_ID=MMETSP1074-20121228/61272_1 /TAXON_ID=2916 /ORGANISM="Ceratium fusus, Strain PA161109" /LENGTH=365 /DNA_ID=CAMNT_0013536703 /DNA_START=125 /DNA_END=1223 /DNA_ORIENTATION=+
MGANHSCAQQCCKQEEKESCLEQSFPVRQEGEAKEAWMMALSAEGALVDFNSIEIPGLPAIPGVTIAKDYLDLLTSFSDDDGALSSGDECETSSQCSQTSAVSDSYFTQELEELSTLANSPRVVGERRKPYTFKTGSVYDGQWLGNRRHGMGKQRWEDGATYEGQWNDNKAEGNGRFQHSCGGTYVGQWRSNMAHGKGVYYHTEDLTSYHGEWLNDLQHGTGVQVWAEGTQYEGQFVRGNKQGFGIYNWPDKSQYLGAWDGNAINGKGGASAMMVDTSWALGMIVSFTEWAPTSGQTVRNTVVNSPMTRNMGLASSNGRMADDTRVGGLLASSMEQAGFDSRMGPARPRSGITGLATTFILEAVS